MYTFPDNFRAFKALIAAQYSGADVKISPGFKFGETNKSKSFLEKFPLGKVCYRMGQVAVLAGKYQCLELPVVP